MSRGRQPGFQMGAEHRSKIGNSKILSRLIDHVEGRVELSATQVSAGLGLLKKVMPDLASVDHSGEVTTNYVAELPAVIQDADEWARQHSPRKTLQ